MWAEAHASWSNPRAPRPAKQGGRGRDARRGAWSRALLARPTRRDTRAGAKVKYAVDRARRGAAEGSGPGPPTTDQVGWRGAARASPSGQSRVRTFAGDLEDKVALADGLAGLLHRVERGLVGQTRVLHGQREVHRALAVAEGVLARVEAVARARLLQDLQDHAAAKEMRQLSTHRPRARWASIELVRGRRGAHVSGIRCHAHSIQHCQAICSRTRRSCDAGRRSCPLRPRLVHPTRCCSGQRTPTLPAR